MAVPEAVGALASVGQRQPRDLDPLLCGQEGPKGKGNVNDGGTRKEKCRREERNKKRKGGW